MTKKDEIDLFIEAINNLPDDVIRAKFEGRIPGRKARSKNPPDTPFDKTVDLHGLTRKEALRVLQVTLTSARGKRLRILVITGKGKNSGDGRGVIREAVKDYLEKAGSLFVREFKPASRKNGGDGAFEILTK